MAKGGQSDEINQKVKKKKETPLGWRQTLAVLVTIPLVGDEPQLLDKGNY